MSTRASSRPLVLVAILAVPFVHWWSQAAAATPPASIAQPSTMELTRSAAGHRGHASWARRHRSKPSFTPRAANGEDGERRSWAIPVALQAPPISEPVRADDSLPETVLIELRLGQIAARTVPAFRVGDDALLPLTQFFDLAGIRATLSRDGRLEGVNQPGNVSFLIDSHRDTLTWGRRHVPVDSSQILLHDGELYLATSRIEQLLDLHFIIDWPDLDVVVPDPSSLPVAQQRRRVAAREALLRASGAVGTDRALPASRQRAWNGFVLDYSLLTPSADPLGGSSYSVAAGADVLGGSLELGVQSLGPASSGTVRFDGSWLGVWRDNPRVRQLRLGDGPVTGPVAFTMRGATVTNAPYVRPSLLGVTPYTGRLPPGWEVEAYRGGELVGFDSVGPGGEFALQVPILYGENPVDFVAYGPYGEQRRFNQTYRAEAALLPAKRFEYGISGGQCRFLACDGAANLDLRYGINGRWTVQTGADQLWRGAASDLFHPYATITGGLTNAWTVEGEAVHHGLIRAGLNFEPSLDTRLFAEYTRFDAASASPLFNPLSRRDQWDLAGFLRPRPARDDLYFETAIEHAHTSTGVADRARLGASVQVGNVRLLPYLRGTRDVIDGGSTIARGYWGVNSFMLPRASWGPFLRQMWARATFEARGAGQVTAASLVVARPIAATVRLEAGVSWVEGLAGPIYTLTLASLFPSMRAFTTATAPTGSPATLTQEVQGSVIYDRATRRLGTAPGPSLQRSGVAGRVFLDLNGNGVLDPGEPGLRGVRVQVGQGTSYSDSTGAYRVWDILPFEPIEVAVDSLSFESPLWVPEGPNAVLVPAPNGFTAYDVPLVVGAVIEGRVARAGGVGLSGVPLVLTDRRRTDRRVMTTFNDGTFYTMGIRPGEYELAVDPAAQERLGLHAEPRHFVIGASGEGAPSSLSFELVP